MAISICQCQSQTAGCPGQHVGCLAVASWAALFSVSGGIAARCWCITPGPLLSAMAFHGCPLWPFTAAGFAPTPAKLSQRTADGTWTWVPCTVVDYNESTNRYGVHIEVSAGTGRWPGGGQLTALAAEVVWPKAIFTSGRQASRERNTNVKPASIFTFHQGSCDVPCVLSYTCLLLHLCVRPCAGQGARQLGASRVGSACSAAL